MKEFQLCMFQQGRAGRIVQTGGGAYTELCHKEEKRGEVIVYLFILFCHNQ